MSGRRGLSPCMLSVPQVLSCVHCKRAASRAGLVQVVLTCGAHCKQAASRAGLVQLVLTSSVHCKQAASRAGLVQLVLTSGVHCKQAASRAGLVQLVLTSGAHCKQAASRAGLVPLVLTSVFTANRQLPKRCWRGLRVAPGVLCALVRPLPQPGAKVVQGCCLAEEHCPRGRGQL